MPPRRGRQKDRCGPAPVRCGSRFQKGPSTVSSRRTLILVAAIVIGALASFLVYGYVSGVQDKAYDDAQRLRSTW